MELRYWVAFARIPQIGCVRLQLLERAFGDLEAAWRAPAGEIRAAGLDERSVEALVAGRERIDPGQEMAALEGQGVTVLTWHDDAYPRLLKEIHDPPPVLFVRGHLAPEDERSVTVVGTRKVTAYGREATATLARELARNSVTVVSGLARGVDGVAHRGALEAGGRTIAVLGSGVDIIYPREHQGLAEQIMERGALVSEHPLGVRPLAQYFPRRNRILSGMTPGTLVVEAGDHSGAHWTVQHALEQDREVFAVPGSIFSPASRGTNRLIQEGAKLVLTAQDILEELNLSVLGQQQLPFFPPPQPEGDLEARVLAQLSREPLHVDDLARQCGVSMADVNSALTLLELRGLIKEVGSRTFVRAREAGAAYETAG